ncbi:MAG TPA: NAD(P)-dependent oxidoreductase [Acidimicrobiales bacterium]|nr:NAD(P)-dependent oxidoreductase [Acidimicrobiales bacterium]
MGQGTITTVGWVGTGVMGAPMCGHLLEAGFTLRVTSRTRARALPLVERGAEWCSTPAEVAEGADMVVTMVGFPADVRATVLGSGGVLSGAREGAVIADMTTSEPALAEEIFRAAIAKGVASLDAPVSGGDVGARNATLVIMVGGREQDLERARPVFERLGKTATLQGGPGAGQHTKMANQVAIASGMIGVCEALLYAWRAGLDVAKVLGTIGPGAAGSWSLNNYGPRALRGDFEPGFKVDHFIKDLGIALVEARRMKLSLPGLALAEQLYVATSAQGRGERGTHALLLTLAELSRAPWPASRPAGV